MSDEIESGQFGHGDQYDRSRPDQRDDEDDAVDPDQTASAGDQSGGEPIDEPIAGQEPDVSDAPDGPSESPSQAAGRDI